MVSNRAKTIYYRIFLLLYRVQVCSTRSRLQKLLDINRPTRDCRRSGPITFLYSARSARSARSSARLVSVSPFLPAPSSLYRALPVHPDSSSPAPSSDLGVRTCQSGAPHDIDNVFSETETDYKSSTFSLLVQPKGMYVGFFALG